MKLGIFYKKDKIGKDTLQGCCIKFENVNKMSFSESSKDLKIELISTIFEHIEEMKDVVLYSNFIGNIEEFYKILNLKSMEKYKNTLKDINIINFVNYEYEYFNNTYDEKKKDIILRQEAISNIDKIKDAIIIEKVERSDIPLQSNVMTDEFTDIAKKCFDFDFKGLNEFYPYNKPSNIPNEFNIGVIVGASGTGKSTLMKEFGEEDVIEWDNNKSIMSHFNTPEEAVDKLTAVGLNSIPTWTKPYNVLSNGEKFRADLARKIKDNAVIDEFTSVVDRNVAKASSTAISKYIKKNNIKNVVLVTCHEDIIDWLEPDWIFNTNDGNLYDGKSLRRPKLELEIYETKDYSIWETFKNHHYLSADLNKASRRFVALLNGEVIGFSATMTLPNGKLKNAWRGHRTVILPDYQGLGLGMKLSDAIAQIHIDEGKRYYSKTSHIRMGTYRENSPLWRPTVENKRKRTTTPIHKGGTWFVDLDKISFSHEYIGNKK